jgi:IS30 family transposase
VADSSPERPPEIEDRAVSGLGEGDLITGALNQSAIATLPTHLRGSLTWDQDSEMATHKAFTTATDMPVYFCDPTSSWQRGSNENTNGPLEWFPKSTGLSVYGLEDLEHVAQELNARTRKTLGWDTSAERFRDPLITT